MVPSGMLLNNDYLGVPPEPDAAAASGACRCSLGMGLEGWPMGVADGCTVSSWAVIEQVPLAEHGILTLALKGQLCGLFTDEGAKSVPRHSLLCCPQQLHSLHVLGLPLAKPCLGLGMFSPARAKPSPAL